jgi:hypothetical protein
MQRPDASETENAIDIATVLLWALAVIFVCCVATKYV